MSDQLDDLLRTMPRERAPQGFARDVVARLDRPPPRPMWRVAAAGAVAVALVVGVTTWLSSAGERELRAEIAALREQHQQLESRLTELRQRLGATEPVVVVGGNDRVDYVVDLERLSSGSSDELIWMPRRSTGGSL